eukprot:CAMPEP_0117606784 /NCGR_PEP_ID=MMETSP0784-20121206/79886_1 /TAXON_ID=39447 /ORGANISM="" /LENGTH=859 /DNA_ID=CAMNT_0005409867 /DNA_START=44 /DNA_END=2620 /DNA_ORIENTATION=-
MVEMKLTGKLAVPVFLSLLLWKSGNTADQRIGMDQVVGGATGVRFSGKTFRRKPSMTQHCPAAAGCPEAFGKRAARWISIATACRGTQWAVLTTIHEPTPSVQNLAETGEWCVVVVSDLKGPNEYRIPSARTDYSILFLNASLQRWLAADSDFIASIPWNHFGRKNLGYLIAIARGASVIWDFDDDNIVTADSFPPPLEQGLLDVLWAPRAGASLGSAGVLNVYPLLGCSVSPCWPRGFPLTLSKSEVPARSEWIRANGSRNVAMLQSLANNDPDVDAIFRLTSLKPTGIQFHPLGSEALGLPPFVFCPANAQATLHRRDAFWGLLLPMTVSGRVSDIWRSYLFQRLLWDTGLRVAFAPPLVRQDRNVHDYLADFQAEQQLYMQTEELLKFLGSWRSSRPTLPERMEELWGAAYERGYLEVADLRSLRLWILALQGVGYAFPDIDTRAASSHTKANPAATTTRQTDQKHQSMPTSSHTKANPAATETPQKYLKRQSLPTPSHTKANLSATAALQMDQPLREFAQGPERQIVMKSTLAGFTDACRHHNYDNKVRYYHWYGRMGNQLWQLEHAITIAQALGHGMIVFPGEAGNALQNVFNVGHALRLPEMAPEQQGCKDFVTAGDFRPGEYDCTTLFYTHCRASVAARRRVFLTSIGPAMKPTVLRSCSPTDADTLVIHFRNDVRNQGRKGGGGHFPVPCAYFHAVINTGRDGQSFRKIRLLYPREHGISACVNDIKAKHHATKILLDHPGESLEADVCTLLTASSLAISQSSFTSSLVLLSKRVVRLFWIDASDVLFSWVREKWKERRDFLVQNYNLNATEVCRAFPAAVGYRMEPVADTMSFGDFMLRFPEQHLIRQPC